MTVEDIIIDPTGYIIKKVTYTQAELAETIEKARQIEGQLNPHAPDGNIRDDETISVKNLGGLISEKVVHDLLELKINSNSIDATIIGSNFEEIDSAEFQIDHVVQCNDNTRITIETRSSFSYRTRCPENVVNYAFQIIGPYITENKYIEHPKDFYAFLFYCLNPDLLKETIDNGEISVYFAGGASLDMLKKSDNNLKQRGTIYKTVKPITNGFNANTFFDKLFQDC